MKDNSTKEIFEAIRKTINCEKNNDYIGLHEPFFKGSNALKYLKDCIENDSALTPHVIYYALMTSNEYRQF